MNKPKVRAGKVGTSITITKTPPLKPNSRSTSSKERLPQVRQSQLPPAKPAPVSNSERAQRLPVKKSKITSDMDPFEASEILRKELHEEFGDFEDDKVPDLPWMNHLDELNDQITANMNQSSSIDNSFANTFNDATKNFECNENIFDSATKMMNVGFDAVQNNLTRTRDLIDQRLDLVQQMMNEIRMHGVDEFTADLKPDDNPLLDEPDSGSTEKLNVPKMPTADRNAPPRNSQARNQQARNSQAVRNSQFPRGSQIPRNTQVQSSTPTWTQRK